MCCWDWFGRATIAPPRMLCEEPALRKNKLRHRAHPQPKNKYSIAILSIHSQCRRWVDLKSWRIDWWNEAIEGFNLLRRTWLCFMSVWGSRNDDAFGRGVLDSPRFQGNFGLSKCEQFNWTLIEIFETLRWILSHTSYVCDKLLIRFGEV